MKSRITFHLLRQRLRRLRGAGGERRRCTEELRATGLAGEVAVIETGCLGLCAWAPMAWSIPRRSSTRTSNARTCPSIVEEHLLKGRAVSASCSAIRAREKTIAEMQDIPFFKRQIKIVLRNCGIIDPLKIEEYIARDGYEAPGQGAHRDDARSRSSTR